jgi:hypothetical protein
VQLAARAVHGANSNANTNKTIHRKRIATFILFAWKSSFSGSGPISRKPSLRG